MLFKIRSQKEILRTEKSSFPFTAFLCRSKEAYGIPSSTIFFGVNGPLGS